MVRSRVLATALVLAAAGSASAGPRRAEANSRQSPRTLKRRTLAITDANLNEVQTIHVGGGIPTTVSFRQAIRPESVILADTSDVFLPLKASESSIVLIAKRDLAPHTVATLTVTLADGTIVPLLLTTEPREADIGVDIGVSLVQKARPESAQALKASVLELRAELEECRTDTGTAGVAKVARLVLQEEGSGRREVEVRDLHRRDKQERLLVEVVRAYRFFGHSYLVLTLENRDPGRPWALDRPELTAIGNGSTTDVHIAFFELDVPVLGAGEAGKLVVAFPTPPPGSGESFRLELHEKNGSRQVRLDGLSL
jgi:uncharacterized protein (TIGR02268 family)